LKKFKTLKTSNASFLEHEPFWRYLSRLNDYRAQLNHRFQKWKICKVIAVGLNVESRCYVESISPEGLIELLSKTQDEVWDFFEKVALEIYAFEQANDTFRYPTHGQYDFHANPYPPDLFINSYGPSYSCVLPILCDYCQSSSHDAQTCPYHAYVNATYESFQKKINEMTDQIIETMKARIAACS